MLKRTKNTLRVRIRGSEVHGGGGDVLCIYPCASVYIFVSLNKNARDERNFSDTYIRRHL